MAASDIGAEEAIRTDSAWQTVRVYRSGLYVAKISGRSLEDNRKNGALKEMNGRAGA
jgi:hypothetical protein